jgi:hypothetical protein
MQPALFVFFSFGCIMKKMFDSNRHDFGAKPARKTPKYGGVGTKNAENRAA